MSRYVRFSRAAAVVLFTAAGIGAAQATAVRDPVQPDGMSCFNGYAYALESGDYRYTAHNEQTRHNGQLTDWTVTYVGRDGQVIARKQLDFSDNQTVPSYSLSIPRSGYREGITYTDDQWLMVRREKAEADIERKSFELDPPIAGDSGFNNLVKKHFSELQSGKTVKFSFVAAGRQSVLDLKASKSGTTTFHGQEAVVFKAELDMFLVHYFVGSLKLTYNPDTKRLLEYRGIGNIHNTDGDTYPVRVDYDPTMPTIAKKHQAPAARCAPNP